jgi:hypothetical protein
MVEVICILCVAVLGYFLAWREDKKHEQKIAEYLADEELHRRQDEEFDRMIQEFLKPLPRNAPWSHSARCAISRQQDQLLLEQEEEELDRLEKKRAKRKAKLEREQRLIGDWLAVAGYDTPQEDALMGTLIDVESALGEIEYGYSE